MSTYGHEDGVEAPLITRLEHVFHLVVEPEPDSGCQDAGHLVIEHIPGQAISGNAKAQHATGQRARLADLHLMAEAIEVPGT
ncbi:hypothetical protein D3C80_2039870 [compost metagenome]